MSPSVSFCHCSREGPGSASALALPPFSRSFAFFLAFLLAFFFLFLSFRLFSLDSFFLPGFLLLGLGCPVPESSGEESEEEPEEEVLVEEEEEEEVAVRDFLLLLSVFFFFAGTKQERPALRSRGGGVRAGTVWHAAPPQSHDSPCWAGMKTGLRPVH